MEQNIKNFDRSIEQKMNEHEVAPPFGMWNRIASELEAMPVAATVAPAATALIPKRAVAGIIAAALIMGATALTGYLVTSSAHNNNAMLGADAGSNKQLIAASVKPVNHNTVQQTIPVKTQDDATATNIIARPRVRHANAASTPVQQTLQAAQQVQPGINKPVENTMGNTSMIMNNANTDVPTPIEPVAQQVDESQTYYFPPIDVNTPESNRASSPATTTKSAAQINAASGNNSDDKTRIAASSGNEHKGKFRPPHRRKRYAYPSIIR